LYENLNEIEDVDKENGRTRIIKVGNRAQFSPPIQFYDSGSIRERLTSISQQNDETSKQRPKSVKPNYTIVSKTNNNHELIDQVDIFWPLVYKHEIPKPEDLNKPKVESPPPTPPFFYRDDSYSRIREDDQDQISLNEDENDNIVTPAPLETTNKKEDQSNVTNSKSVKFNEEEEVEEEEEKESEEEEKYFENKDQEQYNEQYPDTDTDDVNIALHETNIKLFSPKKRKQFNIEINSRRKVIFSFSFSFFINFLD
jgi:hypothetical protein